MERNQPEAAAVSGGVAVPKNACARNAFAEREPFSATRREMLASGLMYALAYLYTRMYGAMLSSYSAALPRVLLAVFTLGFIALTEHLHHDTPRSRESFVWLFCVAALLASVIFLRGRAWEGGIPLLFLHVFAVWWVLSRSGALMEGKSERMLPLDALNGFVVFPFKHFFLQARTAFFAFSRMRGEKKAESGSLAWTLVIAAAALGLLALATSLLMSADEAFAKLLGGFAERFRFDWDLTALDGFLLRLFLSLPVGAYLFGLVAGTRREDKGVLRKRVARIDGEFLPSLRGVAEHVWLVLLALFCALYALFFVVQGRYLFGAFTRTLPDGFVVAEYARQGFFELCKVMAVNFALLYLATRTSKKGARGGALLTLCLALLAESLLFAVVALSKLWLYIDCFGFTPRRLQSTWLVCVLAFGTLCAAWSLLRRERTFRVFLCFGAVTLSLLCLY